MTLPNLRPAQRLFIFPLLLYILFGWPTQVMAQPDAPPVVVLTQPAGAND